ncbi:MAG: pyridoxamine 5-phosphate oxidase family protein [Sediminibacterium sp.]|nr:pyridoxamine 5-phosphate oxidase family protein [Sediminibacterium sp.]
MLGELTKQEIQNILLSQVLGRLACCDGKQPYVVPVTFTYDGEYIYGQTNEGTKLTILRKNPSVCFEVDVMTDMMNWRSVVVLGKFEELKDEEEKTARNILFGRIFSLMTSNTIHKHEHEVVTELDKRAPRFVMYRIKIKEISGRFEKQS